MSRCKFIDMVGVNRRDLHLPSRGKMIFFHMLRSSACARTPCEAMLRLHTVPRHPDSVGAWRSAWRWPIGSRPASTSCFSFLAALRAAWTDQSGIGPQRDAALTTIDPIIEQE